MYVPTMNSLSAAQTYLAEPPKLYDRKPPSNVADYPKCATQAVHDAAHRNCKPMVVDAVLRGLGVLDLNAANPCWVETLPICPVRTPPKLTPIPPRPAPVVRTPPKLTPVPVRTTAPAPVRTPPKLTPVPAPVPAPVRTPPKLYVAAPAPSPSAPAPTPSPSAPAQSTPRPPPVLRAPPSSVPQDFPPSLLPEEAPPAQAGFSTGGLLALAAAAAIGGWLLFGKKKPQAA